jgi:hypothetical protein
VGFSVGFAVCVNCISSGPKKDNTEGSGILAGSYLFANNHPHTYEKSENIITDIFAFAFAFAFQSIILFINHFIKNQFL